MINRSADSDVYKIENKVTDNYFVFAIWGFDVNLGSKLLPRWGAPKNCLDELGLVIFVG